MGFAIPITRAMPIINDLMNREKIAEGEAGFLGIAGSTVSSDMISGYGWPEGVYIDSVVEGGPAEESGILPRDIVMIRMLLLWKRCKKEYQAIEQEQK